MKAAAWFITLLFCSISFTPTVMAQVWCVEEFAQKQAAKAGELKPVEESVWNKLISEIGTALEIPGGPGSIQAIPCSNNRNAQALVVKKGDSDKIGAGEYIVYDPDWFKQVIGDNRAQATFLFGHEIGHFLGRHSWRDISQPAAELEADQWGACAVARLKLPFVPVVDLIKRLRPVSDDGTYPSQSQSISAAEKQYATCGGVPPSCGQASWYFCPSRQYHADWKIDLMIMDVEIGKFSSTTRSLELRTNTSDGPIAQFAPSTATVSTKPSRVYIDVRSVDPQAIPSGFGLGDYANFIGMDANSKSDSVVALYERYKRDIGQGLSYFDSSTGQNHNVNVGVSDGAGADRWSITTRLANIPLQIEKGGGVLIFREITIPIDDNRFFLDTESDGFYADFTTDNSFITIRSAASGHKINPRSANIYAILKDGHGDERYGLKNIDKSDDVIVVHHQNLEASSSLRVNVSWK